MQGTLNAHRLLRGSDRSDGYIQNLTVSDGQEKKLRRARDLVRATLKEGMQALRQVAVAKGLIERRHFNPAAPPTLTPRFRMQGSATYRTLNDPAHRPPQQIDYDDGFYLPTSFVTHNGSTEPIVVAKGLFAVVEEILKPLCARNGWALNRTKNSCVRVVIADDAHIDLALYAIPDQDFVRLAEDAAANFAKAFRGQTQDADILFEEQIYKSLPADRIMLAQRDGTWIESDPRKLENWFRDAIAEHDDGLRYVCRYVKGWRDFQWEDRRLTSIAIMACVVKAYDELRGTLPDDRDDTALLAVAAKLPVMLNNTIRNPVIPDQSLDENWTATERADFVGRAKRLYAELDGALNGGYHKALAITALRREFGERIPDDETLLGVDRAEREVLSYAPARVAAPFVPRSTSG